MAACIVKRLVEVVNICLRMFDAWVEKTKAFVKQQIYEAFEACGRIRLNSVRGKVNPWIINFERPQRAAVECTSLILLLHDPVQPLAFIVFVNSRECILPVLGSRKVVHRRGILLLFVCFIRR